jgi:hypothetical protein
MTVMMVWSVVVQAKRLDFGICCFITCSQSALLLRTMLHDGCRTREMVMDSPNNDAFCLVACLFSQPVHARRIAKKL